MDRVLISWSVPNLITIWLMLFFGLFLLALISQYAMKGLSLGGGDASDSTGGY